MRFSLAALALLMDPVAQSFGAQFIGLDKGTRVADASADGSVVVGHLSSSDEAFIWSRDGGLQTLGRLSGHTSSSAQAVSLDGATVVGTSRNHASDEEEGFIWSASQGMVGLGDLPGSFFASTANDVSADGGKVVGSSWALEIPDFGGSTLGFIWQGATGMTDIGPSSGTLGSIADSISNNGNRVVGRSRRDTNEDRIIWLWDESNNRLLEIGSSFTNGGDGRPQLSGDGSTVVGTKRRTEGELDREPFIWTSEQGTQALSGWDSNADRYVTAVSNDGSTIFGWDWGTESNVLWHEAIGPRDLFHVLATEHGLASELAAWDWFDVKSVSSDGRTLVGNASGSQGLVASLDRPIDWIAGDANLDFDVDFDDFLRLAEGFGETGEWENGDFDSDGKVEFADFLLLANNFGVGPLISQAESVPEPTSTWPLYWALTILLSFVRYKSRRVSAEG